MFLKYVLSSLKSSKQFVFLHKKVFILANLEDLTLIRVFIQAQRVLLSLRHYLHFYNNWKVYGKSYLIMQQRTL